MDVRVVEVDPRDWPDLEEAHIWQSPTYLQGITPLLCLLAYRHERLCGSWVVPLSGTDQSKSAVRTPRLLPYSSPLLLDVEQVRRRRTLWALLYYLKQRVHCIGLPMDPDFSDIGALNDFGGLCEARHTHQFTQDRFSLVRLPAKTRNHIHAARGQIYISIETSHEVVLFERAIHAITRDELDLRVEVLKRLANHDRLRIVVARTDQKIVGQLVLVRSKQHSIFLHTWHDTNVGIRGIPSCLVCTAAEYSFQEWTCRIVDLEGSIISTVDHFMDGVGAIPVLYPMFFWANSVSGFARLLRSSLTIAGRANETR